MLFDFIKSKDDDQFLSDKESAFEYGSHNIATFMVPNIIRTFKKIKLLAELESFKPRISGNKEKH
jgi:hypothetical protein